jgi:hypothetical protein
MANSAYRFSLASDSVAGMANIQQTLECKEQALKAGELADDDRRPTGVVGLQRWSKSIPALSRRPW